MPIISKSIFEEEEQEQEQEQEQEEERYLDYI